MIRRVHHAWGHVSILFVLLLVFTCPENVWGQERSGDQVQSSHNLLISYQGRLTDTDGNPVADGSHELEFKLYNQQSGGTALWSETQNLETANGVFTAHLGQNNSLSSLSFDQTYYLGITVDGGSELTPRTRLTTAPYAQRAHNVDDGSITAEKLAQSGAGDGQILRWDEANSRWETATISGSGSGWSLSGNSGLNSGEDFLGTTDTSSLVLKVNSTQAFQLIPEDTTASIVMGNPGNKIAEGVEGSVISGGGRNMTADPLINEVNSDFSVISGGLDNTATGSSSTIGGGQYNATDAHHGTVSGGYNNEARAIFTTVGGGLQNIARGENATVGGGDRNIADGKNSTVIGGTQNTAEGEAATVAGGEYNSAIGDFSFAAGFESFADHDGSFIWSDASRRISSTTGPNQFIVYADGGVGLGTNDPDAPVHIASNNKWDLANSEGDFKIGNDDYRLKIGLATGGGGAGSVNMWAHGGSGKLSLGSNGTNVVSVQKSEGLFPDSDNAYALGTSDKRWTAVYAANGTIQTSDRRLKSDIRNLDYGLEEVLKLDPVSYRWNEQSNMEQTSGERHIGLIAQEVQDVLDEVVKTPQKKKGYLGMSYTELVPVLVKAIQEQQKQIQSLTNKLKNRTAVSEAKVEEIKQQVLKQLKQELGGRADHSIDQHSNWAD